MLISDEEADIKEAEHEAREGSDGEYGNTVWGDPSDTFRMGWEAGKRWERRHHAAMAREMCGPNGEHGEPGHPIGHSH